MNVTSDAHGKSRVKTCRQRELLSIRGVTVFVFIPNCHGKVITVRCTWSDGEYMRLKKKKSSVLTPNPWGDNDAPIVCTHGKMGFCIQLYAMTF